MELHEPNETQHPILREVLRRELAATAADLRLLKRWWRTRADAREKEPPATHSGLGLHGARRRATLLHLALAHSRRRVHLRVWNDRPVASLAEQAALLADELDQLDRLLVSRPALDEAWRARLKVILAA